MDDNNNNGELQPIKLGRKERIKLIRITKHASVIQARWRGIKARRSIYNLVKERKERKENTISFNELGVGVKEDNKGLQETRLQEYERVLFNKLIGIEFCIDWAVGLPVNCTVSRVSAKLINSKRVQHGKLSYEFSDPDTDTINPSFDLSGIYLI
jgi:hypothetical protein